MEINKIVINQRAYFNTGVTKDLKFRLQALDSLYDSIIFHENDILLALKKDLNKSDIEAYMTEISLLKADIKYIRRRLPRWVKPTKVRTALMQMPARCYVVKDPYGVSLIMSPWNYPLLLALSPLVGSIAGGNCTVIKPSAYAKETSLVIDKIINKAFSPEYCTVVQGGRTENTELLQQKFDYIFFTGSVEVGKLVMESAAKNLTPITLELGGKSPVIIEASADIDKAAKKLVFGKYINAGQTCIAPDYVLVPEKMKDQLISSLRKYINEFYPQDNEGSVIDYPKIISEKHFLRLQKLIETSKVVIGGKANKQKMSIEPTVMEDINYQSPVMQEEIFGPILPLITYTNLDEVLKKLQASPKPLALYLFTNNKDIKKKVLREISFGGGCINDVIMHIATSQMGFGGVGDSGMGSYHGKLSFDTFTHKKSIVDKGKAFDLTIRYRPYTDKKKEWLRKF
ncbi:MAG TPA: aldehyde dehydrogenase [Bacilli bacterium]|nr:aldehyde dehydrogenase [Bacilli bacterium]